MGSLSIQKEMSGSVDAVCETVTNALKPIGFGILTRIDFDQKIQEKLGEKIDRCAILGACNPRLALEAYRQSTDVALLIPCNVVVREISPGRVMVEAMRPTMMLEFVKGVSRSESILKAEQDLERSILSL
jgi:uncharacterized protein (DUF302 family)